MKVREIMTTDIERAAPDTTLDEIAGMMRDENVGAIPVVDEDELIGIVTDRDIVIRCIADGKDPADVAAEEIVSENLETIEPDDDVEEAARIMAQRQIRRLPVVEDGQLVGMLSLGDIAVKQGDEEVAGETLEEVSRGVKDEGRGPGTAEPARISGRAPKGTAMGGRQQQLERNAGRKQMHQEGRSLQPRSEDFDRANAIDRGGRRGAQGGGKTQGISNQGAGREQQRQERVVPIRAQAKRGAQGRKTSRRKAS